MTGHGKQIGQQLVIRTEAIEISYTVLFTIIYIDNQSGPLIRTVEMPRMSSNRISGDLEVYSMALIWARSKRCQADLSEPMIDLLGLSTECAVGLLDLFRSQGRKMRQRGIYDCSAVASNPLDSRSHSAINSSALRLADAWASRASKNRALSR